MSPGARSGGAGLSALPALPRSVGLGALGEYLARLLYGQQQAGEVLADPEDDGDVVRHDEPLLRRPQPEAYLPTPGQWARDNDPRFRALPVPGPYPVTRMPQLVWSVDGSGRMYLIPSPDDSQETIDPEVYGRGVPF